MARIDELKQVVWSTRLATDSTHLEATKWVPLDECSGACSVDVQVAYGEALFRFFNA